MRCILACRRSLPPLGPACGAHSAQLTIPHSCQGPISWYSPSSSLRLSPRSLSDLHTYAVHVHSLSMAKSELAGTMRRQLRRRVSCNDACLQEALVEGTLNAVCPGVDEGLVGVNKLPPHALPLHSITAHRKPCSPQPRHGRTQSLCPVKGQTASWQSEFEVKCTWLNIVVHCFGIKCHIHLIQPVLQHAAVELSRQVVDIDEGAPALLWLLSNRDQLPKPGPLCHVDTCAADSCC